MSISLKTVLSATSLILLAIVSAIHAQTPPRSEPYALGADISWVQERTGGQWPTTYRHNGRNMDMLDILKENGFNYIRLRLFVDPRATDPSKVDGSGWNPYPYSSAGYCGLDSTVKYAKKVKDAGYKFLLDFHYSDTWADPGKQYKPKSWEGLSFTQLTEKVRTYTKESVQKFVDAGARPDMVQVGNEVVGGMIHPDGSTSNWGNFARLVHAGIRGVREVDPNIQIMMHTISERNPNGWVNNLVTNLNNVEANFASNVNVIGLSYYPKWHGDRDSLNRVLNAIVNNTNAFIRNYKVCVVEYADYHRQVNDLVFNLKDNRGFGTFVWEPQEFDGDDSKPLFDWRNNGRETNSRMALYPQMAQDYGLNDNTNIADSRERRAYNKDAGKMTDGIRIGHSGIINYDSDAAGVVTVSDIRGRTVGKFDISARGRYDPARHLLRPLKAGVYIITVESADNRKITSHCKIIR